MFLRFAKVKNAKIFLEFVLKRVMLSLLTIYINWLLVTRNIVTKPVIVNVTAPNVKQQILAKIEEVNVFQTKLFPMDG